MPKKGTMAPTRQCPASRALSTQARRSPAQTEEALKHGSEPKLKAERWGQALREGAAHGSAANTVRVARP